MAVDKFGNVYIADYRNSLVEEVTTAGNLTVIAGGGILAPSTTPHSATSVELLSPGGIYVDSSGSVYIANSWTASSKR